MDTRMLKLERSLSEVKRLEKGLLRSSGETMSENPTPVEAKFVTKSWATQVLAELSTIQMTKLRKFYSNSVVPSVPIRFAEDDVIIDVGANLGRFSHSMRRACEKCIIVAFECIPEYAAFAFNVLSQSDEQAQVDEEYTYVIPMGLSDKNGKSQIFMHPINYGYNSMIEPRANSGMVERGVDMVKLDDLDLGQIISLSKVKLIKIDTEGAEIYVLKGMRKFLSSLFPKPVLLVEIAWGANNHPYWDRVLIEFEWLFSHGWKRVDLSKIVETQDVWLQPV